MSVCFTFCWPLLSSWSPAKDKTDVSRKLLVLSNQLGPLSQHWPSWRTAHTRIRLLSPLKSPEVALVVVEDLDEEEGGADVIAHHVHHCSQCTDPIQQVHPQVQTLLEPDYLSGPDPPIRSFLPNCPILYGPQVSGCWGPPRVHL